jgi:hypothetical protein
VSRCTCGDPSPHGNARCPVGAGDRQPGACRSGNPGTDGSNDAAPAAAAWQGLPARSQGVLGPIFRPLPVYLRRSRRSRSKVDDRLAARCRSLHEIAVIMMVLAEFGEIEEHMVLTVTAPARPCSPGSRWRPSSRPSGPAGSTRCWPTPTTTASPTSTTRKAPVRPGVDLLLHAERSRPAALLRQRLARIARTARHPDLVLPTVYT